MLDSGSQSRSAEKTLAELRKRALPSTGAKGKFDFFRGSSFRTAGLVAGSVAGIAGRASRFYEAENFEAGADERYNGPQK